jgi:hypothetical protein
MNTNGHAEIAEEAGLPLLRDTFGNTLKSLRAVQLGNWLTDVSQAIDPVAYASAAQKSSALASSAVDQLRAAMDSLVEEVLGAMTEYMPDPGAAVAGRVLERLRDVVGRRGDEAKRTLLGAIDQVFSSQSDERSSRLGEFFRSTFLVIGYFKFVHPELPGKPPRMDFECFMRVFGRPNDARGAINSSPALDRPGAYTQYYPHEHVDRPELLPPRDPAVYSPGVQVEGVDNAVKAGSRPGMRAGKRRRDVRPDLYSYLRDNLEMTAGLLAEVDRDLRRLIRSLKLKQPFAGDPKLLSLERNPEFHLSLAKLGHALHQVEDFFAHSNWVDLAVQRRGSGYLDKFLPKQTSSEFLDRARTVVEKRLRRHLTSPKPDWRAHDKEKWVVTGYFDLRDTLVSIIHLAEEAWGGDVPDPYAAADKALKELKETQERPSAVVAAAQKLLRESLDFLSDPETAQLDSDNEIARLYAKNVGKDLKRLTLPPVQKEFAARISEEAPLLANAPGEVREALFTALVVGSQLRGGMGLYKSLRTLGAFVSNPVDWLLKQLPEKLRDAVVFYARERVYDAIAMDRLGCHSLMAKDHGLEPLYEPNKQCATAVHYFIVKTLLRFREESAPEHVDWLALLEFFLQNPTVAAPSVGQRVKVSVSVNHTVKEGEQLDTSDSRYSLTHRYRQTAVSPAKFTWRTIADANFNTSGLSDKKARQIINATLRDRAWGVPVRPPNYAFKSGIIIRIPAQKIERQVPAAATDAPEWYDTVMEKDWKVFRGSKDPDTGAEIPPLEPYKPEPVARSIVDAIVTKGRRMRMEARQAYRPNRG